MSEASLYEKNCFVTLTYDEKHLPVNGSVDVSEWQGFMKRLRKEHGAGIRFYHCGEYGEKLGRPHYHGLLFNHDFDDKVLFSERNGNRVYTSGSLGRLWNKGFSLIGDVTFESAAYVARYVMKKVTGVRAPDHYGDKRPEYTTMSRRPGIGRGWFDKFKKDVYPSDEVIVNGRRCKPPRFFDNLLDSEDPALLERLKDVRKEKGRRMVPLKLKGGKTILVNDNDSFRLRVKEEVKLARVATLKRGFESL